MVAYTSVICERDVKEELKKSRMCILKLFLLTGRSKEEEQKDKVI